MSTSIGKLTVFFEEPFWVGVFERIESGKLSVSKVTFGAEPKDYEIYEFVLQYYNSLRFSPAIETVVKEEVKNPKKRQKEIHKQMSAKGIGTKSQQALNLQREQYKKQRKIENKSTHNRRERPVHGHRGRSRGPFYYRITTFGEGPWDARDPHKTTFMTLK